MSIQTEISHQDFKAFVKYIAVSTGGGSMYRLLFGSALGVGVILGILGVTFRLQPADLLVGFIGAVLWLTIFSKLHARNMGPARDSYIIGPRTVLVTDEGIREVSQKHESVFRWKAVRAAESVGEHIFIMVDRNAAIIVPHRAFPSDAERDRFMTEIQKRVGIVQPENGGTKMSCSLR
jgi:hypothetical protein